MKTLIFILLTFSFLWVFRKAAKAKDHQKKIDRTIKTKYYYPKN